MLRLDSSEFGNVKQFIQPKNHKMETINPSTDQCDEPCNQQTNSKKPKQGCTLFQPHLNPSSENREYFYHQTTTTF